MLIASTYQSTVTESLPAIPFYPESYQDAARVFFHYLYLNIFTGKALNPQPFFSPASPISLKGIAEMSKDPVLREAVSDSHGALTSRILNSMAINSGLVASSSFHENLVNWVLICYGTEFPRGYDALYPIVFNEQGGLYDDTNVWPLTDITLNANPQQLSNLSLLSPLYRWLTVVTKSVLSQDASQFDTIFSTILPLMAGPLNPVSLLRSGGNNVSRIPLNSLANIVLRINHLTPPTLNEGGEYSTLSRAAWTRFLSFGNATLKLEDPESAAAYLTDVAESVAPDVMNTAKNYLVLSSIIQTLARANTSLNSLSMNEVEGSSSARLALEAFDLISADAVSGNGTDSTAAPATQSSDDDDPDPATEPTSTTSADNAETDAGDNPMSVVQKNDSSVNNNSIGETSSGSKTLDAITPEKTAGKAPGQLNQDYLYLMSVVTLNSRIREEPDFSIAPSSRAALESWCRYWIWIYPVSDTKVLMKEWGLQSLLGPF